MLHNSEHFPISVDLSPADQAAEEMRSRATVARVLSVVPEEWADRFTPEEWAKYQRERFDAWHSYAVANLSPEAYLNGARCRNMV